jgi:glycosyltransferase involved in cell wall biosynthesis
MTQSKLIISGNFSQAYVVGLLNALIRAGNSIIAIGKDYNNFICDPDMIQFVDIRKYYSTNRTTFRKILDLPVYYFWLIHVIFKANPPIVLNLFSGRPFLSGIILHGILKLSGIKIFLVVHNILPHNKTSFINKILHYVIYRITTNKLIVHAPHLKQRLIKEFGLSPTNVVYAPMGIYNVISNSDITRETARNDLKIAQDRFVILSFGVQLPYKGTHLLLESLSAFVAKENYLILIRGKAKSNYNVLLQNIVTKKQLQTMVNSSFDFVPENEVQLYFKAADVIALPYLEDSQSAVMFTAYSFGRPVLASNIGSFADFIESGKTGEIFKVGNLNSLTQTIIKMRNNKSFYNENYIKKTTTDLYSWEKCIEALSTLYF